MSDCRPLLRLNTSNAIFFQGFMRETNKDLHCYAFIPLPIFCIISTFTIIPITTRLFTVPLSIQDEISQDCSASLHTRNGNYSIKQSKCILFRVRKTITDFAIYFVNRPIKLSRISLLDRNFTLTNNGDKSSHDIVSHTGKQWINTNNEEWIKIYAHLGIDISFNYII